jgi:cell division initiation protein
MKITPLEIRQKEFEKKLRGYDKDEVSAFLLSLSNEWERVLDENKELNIKLTQAEKEVDKLREVESSLFKTLKTAEQTGANVIDQANKAADLHMKETKMNAEALLNESKSKAQAMIEQAEMEAKQIIDELQEAVKNIENNFHHIEDHRQNSIQELKNLSISLMEKVERATKENKEFNFEDYKKRVKALAKESESKIKSEKTSLDQFADTLEVPPLDIAKVVDEAREIDHTMVKKEPSKGGDIEDDPGDRIDDQVSKMVKKAPTKGGFKEDEELEKVTRKKPEPEKKKQEEVKATTDAGSKSFFDELDLD